MSQSYFFNFGQSFEYGGADNMRLIGEWKVKAWGTQNSIIGFSPETPSVCHGCRAVRRMAGLNGNPLQCFIWEGRAAAAAKATPRSLPLLLRLVESRPANEISGRRWNGALPGCFAS